MFKTLTSAIDPKKNPSPEEIEKNFLKPLYLMVEPMNYDLEKETEELEDW